MPKFRCKNDEPHRLLRELFEERPMWTRVACIYRTRLEDHILKWGEVTVVCCLECCSFRVPSIIVVKWGCSEVRILFLVFCTSFPRRVLYGPTGACNSRCSTQTVYCSATLVMYYNTEETTITQTESSCVIGRCDVATHRFLQVVRWRLYSIYFSFQSPAAQVRLLRGVGTVGQVVVQIRIRPEKVSGSKKIPDTDGLVPVS